MKRLITSIALIVYFTVSSGFAVDLHYCMNRLDSFEIGSSGSDQCGKCGMETEDSNGCCRDEVKVVKLATDHLVSQMITASFTLPAVLTPSSHFLYAPLYITHVKGGVVAHSPPLISEQDRYLQFCVFRI